MRSPRASKARYCGLSSRRLPNWRPSSADSRESSAKRVTSAARSAAARAASAASRACSAKARVSSAAVRNASYSFRNVSAIARSFSAVCLSASFATRLSSATTRSASAICRSWLCCSRRASAASRSSSAVARLRSFSSESLIRSRRARFSSFCFRFAANTMSTARRNTSAGTGLSPDNQSRTAGRGTPSCWARSVLSPATMQARINTVWYVSRYPTLEPSLGPHYTPLRATQQ